MTVDSREQKLIANERAFWDSMKAKDGRKAGMMTADGCIVVGAQGVGAINGEAMEKMMAGGTWELKEYSFDEKSMQVRFITDDIAVVAYKVNEQVAVDGETLSFEANDSSVWVNQGGEWRCA
ncbi:MAG: nuclear transport factor 2 family protein, partial [Gemmatimonadaceae bacterium]|nr:nuclear transport factor 2 family protein [Gemmatimonadaceae bacterium]